MPGAVETISAPPLTYPEKTGRLLGVLDEITVRAAMAATLHTDPDVLRARLRQVAEIASVAADAYR